MIQSSPTPKSTELLSVKLSDYGGKESRLKKFQLPKIKENATHINTEHHGGQSFHLKNGHNHFVVPKFLHSNQYMKCNFTYPSTVFGPTALLRLLTHF